MTNDLTQGLPPRDSHGSSPLQQMMRDHQEARARQDPLADLCMLATVSQDGGAAVRTLVLRQMDERGLGFMISDTSPKWDELHTSPCELLLLYRTLPRQYRIRGTIDHLPAERVSEHWRAKPYESRLVDVAYAELHPQSDVISSPDALREDMTHIRKRYPQPDDVPQPRNLRGVLLVPTQVERWDGTAPDRLHDRRRYRLESAGSWTVDYLMP